MITLHVIVDRDDDVGRFSAERHGPTLEGHLHLTGCNSAKIASDRSKLYAAEFSMGYYVLNLSVRPGYRLGRD